MTDSHADDVRTRAAAAVVEVLDPILDPENRAVLSDWAIQRPRPRLRKDGVPTRIDMLHWSAAELAISNAMAAVERAGASKALTDAVTFLGQARDRVADHMEGLS